MIIEPSIQTDRLILRSYREQDKNFCISMWCDAENGTYMSDPLLENADEKYFSYFGKEMEENPKAYYLIAEWKDTHEAVGSCCMFPSEEGNYDIGYCIHKNAWKKGLGSEMLAAILKWIREHDGVSVTAEVANENRASIALLHKMDFVPQKATRFKKWGEERYFDGYIYQKTL